MENHGTQEVRGNNVVLRMRFSQPSPPKYLSAESRAAYAEERAWVANDFIDYAGRQGKYEEKAVSHDEKLARAIKGNYLDYVARRGTFSEKGEKGQGSVGTGIFGKDGVIEGADLMRMKKLFKETKGNVWHGIISPTKELGDKLLGSKEEAMDFMQACFGRFLSSTHLNEKNVVWYAGWHDDSESGIKHIQFAFCEREPHCGANGKLVYTQKGAIRKTALADALVSFEEYFSGHRDDVHVARDNLMRKIKGLNGSNMKAELAQELIALAKDLPQVKGRAGYMHPDYEPFRGRIDGIAMKMLRDIPEISKSYSELILKVSERMERQRVTASGFENMKPSDKTAQLREDVRVRLGNSILNLAKRLGYEERQGDFEALRGQRLAFIEKAKEEQRIRNIRRSANKKELRRIRRIFDTWYRSECKRDYVEEFYRDAERIQEGRYTGIKGVYGDSRDDR